MTATSKAHTALNAIVDGLTARAGLAGVQIASAPLGGESALESIQFGRISLDQDWAAIGRQSREESLELLGAVWVVKAGANEALLRDVRARAIALLAEIEDFLRLDASIGNVVRKARLVAGEIEQGANPRGRWVEISFTIRADVRLNT